MLDLNKLFLAIFSPGSRANFILSLLSLCTRSSKAFLTISQTKMHHLIERFFPHEKEEANLIEIKSNHFVAYRLFHLTRKQAM